LKKLDLVQIANLYQTMALPHGLEPGLWYFCGMETMIQSPVRFTPGAVAEIKRLMQAPSFDPTHRLRVGVKGGGCSGMTYVLGFDTQKETDTTYTLATFPLLWKVRMKCTCTAWRSTGKAA
jgi:hypothetical protein